MLLLYFPVLAMRSLAEERRARTDQLLLTSPVSVWGIVVGKYLALCTVFALPCLADGIMIVVLWLLGGTASACGANFAALLCYFQMCIRDRCWKAWAGWTTSVTSSWNTRISSVPTAPSLSIWSISPTSQHAPSRCRTEPWCRCV